MILDNGVIRTLDPSLPTCGALAIAGPIVAGGVGTHEWMLPTPERVNLGRPLRAAGVHRLARPLSDLVAGAARRAARGSRLRRRRARARRRPRASGHLDPRHGLAGRGLAGGTDGGGASTLSRETLRRRSGRRTTTRSGSTPPASRAQAETSTSPAGWSNATPTGNPTGILREESAWRFRDRYVTVTEDEWVDATREGIRVANANGVGAIHDKDGWLGAASIFGRIHEQEGLSLRVWQSLPVDRLPEIAALPLRARIGDDFLRLGYVKTFMDGTLGSQTALMLDGSGVEITSREELEEVIRAAAAVGWPVAVHAIGDRANRNALDAFEATQEAWKPLGLRHRIEHTQCLDPADLPRFAELGIACSVQFSHAPSDRDLAERFWGDRLEGTYAFRSLLDSGAVLVNGSDAPVEELDPLAGIRAGVLRTIDDRPGVATRRGADDRAGDRRLDRHAGLARRRRAPPRTAAPRAPRRSRGAVARPVHLPARRARVGRGRVDDGRRQVGLPAAALGLT